MSVSSFLHCCHWAVHFALWAAVVVCGGEWSGVRVYVGDPKAAWSGTSECEPCNRFCSEFRAYNKRHVANGGTRWRIGYSETGTDGQPNDVCILRAMDGESTPYFVGVKDGVEGAKHTGYGPGDKSEVRDINAVLALGPWKLVKIQTKAVIRTLPLQSSLTDDEPAAVARIETRIVKVPEIVYQPVYIERPYRPSTDPAYGYPWRFSTANTYTPRWTWPGTSLREHLVRHGWSREYLATLSQDQLEALHDRDHDSGRVSGTGQINWTPQRQQPYQTPYTPRIVPARQSYAQSSGINIGGMPFGFYSQGTRSNCPGGICPR